MLKKVRIVRYKLGNANKKSDFIDKRIPFFRETGFRILMLLSELNWTEPVIFL